MNISEETLGAYVDGELDAAARAEIEAAMASDREVAQRIERLRALRQELHAAFDGVLREPVPQRLVDTLNAAPSHSQIADFARARAAKTAAGRRRWSWPEWGAIAASVIVGLIVGQMLLRWPGVGPIVNRGGALMARGDLAEALSNQLASTQARDAPVRIGVSFRAKAGDYCRTFALQRGRRLAGVACRENAGWRVEVLARHEAEPGGAGGYEPAGSALPAAVLQAVEEKIAGAPLDAAGEAAARRSNWGVR